MKFQRKFYLFNLTVTELISLALVKEKREKRGLGGLKGKGFEQGLHIKVGLVKN